MPIFLFIGNFAQIDTNETDWDAESPNALLGTYGKDVLQNVTVSANDLDGSGGINDDDRGARVEPVTYDRGGGQISTVTDHSGLYSAKVTLGDGSTRITEVLVIQMTNGDTFVTDLMNSGDLDGLNIQSIALESAGSSNWGGWFVNQSVDGTAVVCFAKGTAIDTPDGPRRIETLAQGDPVCTEAGGTLPVLWISHRMAPCGARTAPVEISAGALGGGLPRRTLRVSPQHRILIGSKITRRMCGAARVFVPAVHLVGYPGIKRCLRDKVIDYYHILLDGHHVVLAEGAPAESLFPGVQALRAFSTFRQLELARLNLAVSQPMEAWQIAYPVLPSGMRRTYLQRHRKNAKPLIDARSAQRADVDGQAQVMRASQAANGAAISAKA
ncbi:Hint domain-containing protein [Roseovarius nanhaiticus]|uniref:Hint domain-containing protein n=1 Tax=Roseovarius nanhaiticus TaxID=573024 RepID=A0A1N7FGG0_9RHOB|nr:Hint domain-containing protein [Roseovarius nanhaiticus]SEK55258.1 Hint domain-containing protein [Roseovarius nanhaiticus]SIR99325.1 Hint domain-containing protein [Roseovarius nanhaiticus]